jgi:hypothetical protein
MRDRKKRENEDLKGEIRQLKKVIKHLKKEAGKAEKKARRQEYDLQNFSVEEELPEPSITKDDNVCENCGKTVQIINLEKQGKFYKCSNCKTQRRKKT